MKILTAGNLGDIIIQASVLNSLQLKIDGVIAPSNYFQIVQEIFDLKEGVVPLKKEIADGRMATFAGFKRDEIFQFIENRLKVEIGTDDIRSLVFSEEDVFRRSENIYKSYYDLIGRRFSIEIPPNPSERLKPFSHLPSVSLRRQDSRRIILCPVGGIKVKEMSVEVLVAISQFCNENKYELAVLLTEFDADPFAASGIDYQVIRLKAGKEFLRSACQEFLDSKMIISIDTAWYHLASIQGFDVLPIPGPRSLQHFQFPKSRQIAYRNTLACFDCFSSHCCVVNGYHECRAKPTSGEIIEKLTETLQISNLMNVDIEKYSFKVREPDLFRLKVFFLFIDYLMPIIGKALQFKISEKILRKLYSIARKIKRKIQP